jgi:phytoene dehydrogenase-like protein
VLMPVDLEDVYGLSGGHIYHGEPALDQLFTMRPMLGWAQYRTPIEGLFLCGSGTHPGGGITGQSGQNAAREILRKIAS